MGSVFLQYPIEKERKWNVQRFGYNSPSTYLPVSLISRESSSGLLVPGGAGIADEDSKNCELQHGYSTVC